ncbi:phospholipase C/P1 nuclease domain-containing protein [Mycena floridula]|nr:phospholipase C/P1 nuclease domain-containing protein [Mycena floridula]
MLLYKLLSSLVLAVPSVVAWGAVGHEVVATIAQIHLHPSVLPAICDILNFTSSNPNEPQCHLAPIATWADKLRFKMRWSASMHYIGALDDHPSQKCIFPGPRGWAGNTNINVLGAIRNDTDILEQWVEDAKVGQGDDYTANEALKFLVHFVGDMHMPLHLTGRDRGGNSDKVLFDGRQTNLHSLWDSLLISKSLRTIPYNYTRRIPVPLVEYNLRNTIYDPYVRRIMWEGILGKWRDEIPSWLSCPKPTTDQTTDSMLSYLWGPIWRFFRSTSSTDDEILCPYAWAQPIHALNCEIVWPKALDEPPYSHGQLAAGPYLELDTPEYAGVIHDEWIIEKLMAQAGIRLAGTLNWLFADLSDEEKKAGLSVTRF